MKKLLSWLVILLLVVGGLEVLCWQQQMEREKLLREWQRQLGLYRDQLVPDYIWRKQDRVISV
ncbi:MAG: hypothetical protein WC734_03030 [Patescibacteria group bacterium]|jgi:hypothetical protein